MSVVDQIERLASEFSGILGVWARSLDTGATIEWNATDAFPAASTIKLPILYEVFRQAADGGFRLSDARTLLADDVVPGSGVLKDLTTSLSESCTWRRGKRGLSTARRCGTDELFVKGPPAS